MSRKFKELEWSSLNPPIQSDREMLAYNDEYNEFLCFANGGRVDDAWIDFQVGDVVKTELLDIFMSFEQMKENDYLLGYVPHFHGEELKKLEEIMKTYKVFCSTYEPNTRFAFSILENDNQAVFYMDFDEYSPENLVGIYKVFNSFNEFIENIYRKE